MQQLLSQMLGFPERENDGRKRGRGLLQGTILAVAWWTQDNHEKPLLR